VFRIVGLDHVVLRVKDVERMVRFYQDVLMCRVERARPEIGLMQLRAGRSLIDMVAVDSELGRRGGAAPDTEGRNMDHLCLRIEPFEPDALARHLVAHGAAPGEVKTRYGAEGEGPSIYVTDPDGNVVELKGPPERGAGIGEALNRGPTSVGM
jgi:catechol 2,3-dioxygenase-like lactoylglutathione lyase family enzyme